MFRKRRATKENAATGYGARRRGPEHCPRTPSAKDNTLARASKAMSTPFSKLEEEERKKNLAPSARLAEGGARWPLALLFALGAVFLALYAALVFLASAP